MDTIMPDGPWHVSYNNIIRDSLDVALTSFGSQTHSEVLIESIMPSLMYYRMSHLCTTNQF